MSHKNKKMQCRYYNFGFWDENLIDTKFFRLVTLESRLCNEFMNFRIEFSFCIRIPDLHFLITNTVIVNSIIEIYNIL